ncbi:MAG: FeoB-associated Cys-rich membrane protein [Lachnospiraceae bacterium]|nr:FeoB-associated Cys-rich membrane protein [Lachnospiraceae bacterium]
MGTVVTAAILICIVGFVARKMIRDKKSGKSLQCGCDCKNCAGRCGYK